MNQKCTGSLKQRAHFIKKKRSNNESRANIRIITERVRKGKRKTITTLGLRL